MPTTPCRGYTSRFVITPDPVYGLALIEELARHGCRIRISPGTIYPLLRGTESRGYLRVRGGATGRADAKHHGGVRAAGVSEFGQDGAVAVTPATAAPSPRT